MRSKSGMTVLGWLMLGAIVFGFGGYGVTNFGGGVGSVGTVGDQTITTKDYYREMEQSLNAYRAQNGQNITAQQAIQAGLAGQVQQRLVVTAALDNADDKLGLSVGNTALRHAISQMKAFQGADGKFDDQTYGFVLDRNNMSKSEFEAQMRKQLSRDLLQQAFAGMVPAPKAYVDTIVAYAGQQRGFSLLKISSSELKGPLPTPTDAELKAYYDAHKADFTQPEAKIITYAALTPDMIASSIKIDDKTLRQLYEKNKADYVTPEKMNLDRLVFPDEAAAKAAKAALDAGTKTFADLVKERGLKMSDINLGNVTQERLSKAAGDAVFARKDKGVVGPVQSALGPALFQINDITPADETSFAEAKDELAQGLQEERAGQQISAQIETINDKLAGGATLEDLAKETKMQLGHIDFTQGDSEGMAAYDAFRAAAEKVKEGDYPQIIQLKDGGIAALRLDSIRKASVIPYDKVADKVKAGWQKQSTDKALAARGAEIVKQVEGGADLASFGKVEAEDPVLRNGYIDGIPQSVIPDVFKLKKTGDLGSVQSGDAVYVYRLDKIEAANTKDEDIQKLQAQLRATAAQGIAGDGFNMFATALMAQTKVKLDQAAISAVNAQFH